MRKILTILFMLPLIADAQFTFLGFNKPLSASPGIVLIDHVGAGSPNAADVTTASINTGGANLLVAAIASYDVIASPTVSDSKGNTWTALTSQSNGGLIRVQLFYTYATSVGSAHTFSTNTGGGFNSYPSIQVFAFSGSSGSFDAENGTTGGASPVSTGTVTPATNGQVIIAALGISVPSTTPTLTVGFTDYYINHDGANHFGLSMGYYIQPTAGAQGCTFTFASGVGPAVIATLK